MQTIQQIERRRLDEQQRLDALKDAEERNRWGQFATPPTLALDIAEYALGLWRNRTDEIRFLDPAIGTGSFYAALQTVFPNKLIEAASGVELDPAFAATAADLWTSSGLVVTEGDFTAQVSPEPRHRFNLVLTNPPYVRHHHLPVKQKERLKARVCDELGIEISGLAGLYCYFLLLCHDWLADDGIGIWLIPSEFMSVNYGCALRRYLTERVQLLHVHRFCPSDVQFSDALVSSAIVVFRKRRPDRRWPVFSFGGRLTSPEREQRVPLSALRSDDKWTKYPGAASKAEPNGVNWRLGDLFLIKRGLATGANDFFILPRDEEQRMGIPPQFTKPILPSPRHLRQIIIESDPDGYPLIEQPLSLIDCDLPEPELRQQFPDFWDYLQSGKRRGLHKLYLPSRRTPWYSQEQRASAPFLCTYMGRTNAHARKPFRFLRNKSKAVAANVYLLLYPKGPMKEALDADPALHEKIFEILQATTLDMFLGESRVYGGGLYKLEPKELARVPTADLLMAIDVNPRRQSHLKLVFDD